MDGIRHSNVLHIIKRLVAPQQVIHVHLLLDEDLREERVAGRQGVVEHDEQRRMSNHPTEEQVSELLPSIADLTISSSETLDAVVQKVKIGAESLLTHNSARKLDA